MVDYVYYHLFYNKHELLILIFPSTAERDSEKDDEKIC